MPITADKAQVTLPSDREVQITRSFRAPRTLVYRAYTEPDLVRRWMGGYPGWTMPVCDMDVRVGGKYRWRWRQDADGTEFGFQGTFRELQPPATIAAAIETWVFFTCVYLLEHAAAGLARAPPQETQRYTSSTRRFKRHDSSSLPVAAGRSSP